MFWGFAIKLLIGSFVTPFIFSLILMPVMGLVILATKGEKTNKIVLYFFLAIALIVQVYFWGLWASYCSIITLDYTSHLSAIKWLYYILGLLFCIAPIGYMASKERGMSTSIEEIRSNDKNANLYSFVAILFYVLFLIFPFLMNIPYGWFIQFWQ
jgi:hypothetical protein